MTTRTSARTEIVQGLAMYAQVHKPSTANNENKFTMDLLLNKEGIQQAKDLGFKIKKKNPREIDAEIMDAEDIERAERYNENIKQFSQFADQGYKGEYITVKLQAEKNGQPRNLTIVDGKKNVIPKDVMIGNGSLVKVKFILQSKDTCEAEGSPVPDHIKKYGAQAYFIPGDSATMQVIKLVEYNTEGRGNDSGFDTVEDSFEVTKKVDLGKISREIENDFESDEIPF